MPIFEFLCKKCGEKTEIILKSSSEAGEARCPVCGEKMLRSFSPFATKGRSSCGHAHSGGRG
ncbi:zinc ribbon domain-containing protein [bacterium]|nr:MAG: zinc ribbon domain-containing protein [bacterium]